MSTARLGLRLLRRDWRGGELGLLLTALLVAVAIVVSIALFVERIQVAILAESSQFLAADRVLRSNVPIDEEWLQAAEQEGLATAQVLNFPTMAYRGEAMQLAAVKAVSGSYPLLGSIDLQRSAGSENLSALSALSVSAGPPAGEIWVSARLLPMLDMQLGETLFIGEAELAVTAFVVREPDAGFSAFSYGPRVLMNISDIPASGVVQPGSRVQYNALVAGDKNGVEAWQKDIKAKLTADQTLLGIRDGQPRLARAIDRAERFLLLAGSMGVILAGVAIAIASRRYTERHYDYVGILKSLGSSSATVLTLYLGQLFLLCLCGIVLGSLLGWGLHLLAIESIRSLLLVELPQPGLAAFGLGALTALISFIAFACPALLHLQHVAPMRVLRRDLGTPDFNSRLVLWLGIAGLLVLIYAYSGSLMITLVLCLGVGSVAVAVLFLTWAMLRAAPALGTKAASSFNLAMAGIRRRAQHSALQVFVFTVVLLLVLVMLLARNSLVEEWRMQIPPGTPNHFLLNIAPDEVPTLTEVLDDAGYESAGIFPMIRANFVGHNGVEPVRQYSDGSEAQRDANQNSTSADDADGPGEQGQRSARSLQLTWAADLPAENELVEGRWWAEAEDPGSEISLELEFAQRYGIELGDVLTFRVVDRTVDLSVTSIRTLDWEQMRPNFYAIASPGSLDQFDAIHMTSFYLPEGDKAFLNRLLAELPTISIIEMDRMIEQVTRIIDQVSSAVELVLGLILLSAAIVLYASIQTSMDERFQENAILKTLGARFGLLRKTVLLEFSILGAIAGFLAAIGAEMVAAIIQTQLLELSFRPHWWVFIVGPVGGACIVAALGMLISRRSLYAPPATVLRELA